MKWLNDEQFKLIDEKFGFCGCGSETWRQQIWETLATLYNIVDDEVGNLSTLNLGEKLGQDISEEHAELIFNVLARENLVEHGGSLLSCWISFDGIAFVEKVSGCMKIHVTGVGYIKPEIL